MFLEENHLRYTLVQLRRRIEVKETNMKIKNIAIVLLTVAVAGLLGVVISLKRAYDLREYSIANNCEWVYQNTYYGDDRDYICK